MQNAPMSETRDADSSIRSQDAVAGPTATEGGVRQADSDKEHPEHRPLMVAGRWQGPDHASPYPISRMAPSFSLVDVAAEIEKADTMLGNVTTGKLLVLAEQIRALQDKAREVLERTRRDAELHRARCSFEKKPGGVYFLYKGERGDLWWSIMGPREWKLTKPEFVGGFRLEADLSFTPIDEIPSKEERETALRRLLPG
jgi:hypothetical protein